MYARKIIMLAYSWTLGERAAGQVRKRLAPKTGAPAAVYLFRRFSPL